MAVSNQDAPNLTPAYGQIMQAQQNRAQMESGKTNLYDVATAGVKRVDQELTARRLFQQQMQSEGRTLITEKDMRDMVDQSNAGVADDKHKISYDEVKHNVGLWRKPDEIGSEIVQRQIQKLAPDAEGMTPLQKKLIQTPEGQKAYASDAFKKEKVPAHVKVKNPQSSTGYSYATIDDKGQTQITNLEAPPEKGGSGTGVSAVDKRFKDLDESIDPSRYRAGAFGVSKQRFDRAENLQSLASAFPDGNLDSRQIEEMAIGLNALLSGSNTGAQQQVKALVPQSVWGNSNKLAEFLSSDPRGTGQQEFVKRLLGTIDREKETAQTQIQRTQFSRIARNADLEKVDPEKFNEILQSHEVDPAEYKRWKKNGFKAISAVVTSETEERVKVTDPKTGKGFTVPKSQLQQALGQGYIRAQ